MRVLAFLVLASTALGQAEVSSEEQFEEAYEPPPAFGRRVRYKKEPVARFSEQNRARRISVDASTGMPVEAERPVDYWRNVPPARWTEEQIRQYLAEHPPKPYENVDIDTPWTPSTYRGDLSTSTPSVVEVLPPGDDYEWEDHDPVRVQRKDGTVFYRARPGRANGSMGSSLTRFR